MAGLLDWIGTPEGQGLLSAAFGGMAGAQRGTPWNNAGRAGMAGIMGYGNAIEQQKDAARQKLIDMQVQQAQMGLDRSKREGAFYDTWNPAKYITTAQPATTELAPRFPNAAPDQSLLQTVPDMAPGLSAIPDYSKQFAPDTPLNDRYQPVDIPAKPGGFDRQAMMADLLGSGVPELQKSAMTHLMPKEAEWNVVERFNTETGKPEKVLINKSDPSQVRPFGGQQADKEGALPWYVKRGADGQLVIDPTYAEMEKTKASFGRSPAAPMQPVAYVDAQGNTVWGTITDARGKPAANYSPALQGDLSSAKAAGRERGESQAKASGSLPSVIAQTEEAIQLTDDLLKHPGMAQAVGKSSLLGIQHVPGTDAKAFMIRLNQLKGKQFLEAYNTLKGGGQITEVEGKKATEAMARMDNASTEEEFAAAAREWQGVLRAGIERAKQKAGQPAGDVPPAKPANAPKTATLADIKETARKSGKTTAEVTQALKAQGYTIRGM